MTAWLTDCYPQQGEECISVVVPDLGLGGDGGETDQQHHPATPGPAGYSSLLKHSGKVSLTVISAVKISVSHITQLHHLLSSQVRANLWQEWEVLDLNNRLLMSSSQYQSGISWCIETQRDDIPVNWKVPENIRRGSGDGCCLRGSLPRVWHSRRCHCRGSRSVTQSLLGASHSITKGGVQKYLFCKLVDLYIKIDPTHPPMP